MNSELGEMVQSRLCRERPGGGVPAALMAVWAIHHVRAAVLLFQMAELWFSANQWALM